MAPSSERFVVSHHGMREIHSGREPWELMKELIQNAWDEAPEATICTVTIEPQVSTGRTRITVEDDGPGFANIADAYTLLGSTGKRADPKKRGRFNLGEKEFVSVANSAKVETAGHTVTFPEKGGRTVRQNKRLTGTVITAEMPWSEEQAHTLTGRLRIFRPTDCRLVVNQIEVPKREPLEKHRATLETVLQESPTAPMRRTQRVTMIHILNKIDTEQSWLYEMGIPIQPIDTPYDIDVQQKVPMPPNRTEVPTRYLRAIYSQTLNAMYPIMDQESFDESWVKQALDVDTTSAEAVHATINARYGDKVLLITNDAEANREALDNGYELINSRSLTPKERERFRGDGGMQTTHQAFPRPVWDPPDLSFGEPPVLEVLQCWIPSDLHQWLKIKAAGERTNMTALVVKALLNYRGERGG